MKGKMQKFLLKFFSNYKGIEENHNNNKNVKTSCPQAYTETGHF